MSEIIEWTGEGLPPVGTVAEFKARDGTWKPGEYVGSFCGKMVVGCLVSGVVGFLKSEEFKPARTPDQIAAEERDAARTEALNAMTADDRTVGESEENWQFRMQIVGEMLDMGYRKQVTP